MKIVYLGHSCLYIKINDIGIIIDPFFKLLYNKEYINSLVVNYIIITHAHEDHIADLDFFRNKTIKIISNFEILTYLSNKGFNGIGMNNGGSIYLNDIYINCFSAFHSSSFKDGTYGGLANGYIIGYNGKYIYIAGDTSIFTDMKLIKDKYGQIDLAILPIGGKYTMNYLDIPIVFDYIKPKKIMGYHYDTFEDIKINKVEVVNNLKRKNIDLILLEILGYIFI